MSSSSGAFPATSHRPGTAFSTFAPLEKAKYLAQDLHILSNGGGRPSSASSTSKQPTERRAHATKLDYVREMLQLERENRKRDQKIMERQAKTIVMLTDHVERVMSAIRSYVENKLINDGKMRDLRSSIQRLRTVIDKQQLSITVHQQLIASSKDTNGVLERQLFDMDRKYTDLKKHLVQLRKQYASTMASLQQQQQHQQQQHQSNIPPPNHGRQGLAKEGSTDLCLGSPLVGSVALKKQFSFNSQQYENDFEDDDEVANGSNHDLDDHSDVLGVLEAATRSRDHPRRNRPQLANAAVLSVNTTHVPLVRPLPLPHRPLSAGNLSVSVSAAHGASTFGLLQPAISPPKSMHKIDKHPTTVPTRTEEGMPSSSSAADSVIMNNTSQQDTRFRSQPDSHSNSHNNQSITATVVLPAGLYENDGLVLPPGDFYAGRGYSFHHQKQFRSSTKSKNTNNTSTKTDHATHGSRQNPSTRRRPRSADATLTRSRTPTNTITTKKDEMLEGAYTSIHPVTPFTPRSLEEWKYVQKYGEQGQDSNIDAQELRWLRFLITDVDGCDEEGNPWITTATKGGRRGSSVNLQGGLEVGNEVDGDDSNVMSPLKWYDEQYTPTTTPLSNHHQPSKSKSRRSKSPHVANEVIQYHQSISTATIIATTIPPHPNAAVGDTAVTSVDTTTRPSVMTDMHHHHHPTHQQKSKHSQQKQSPTPTQSSISGNNSGSKSKPYRRVSGVFDPRALSPVTLPTGKGGEKRGGGVREDGNMEDTEITLTENGLAKLVAKLRKQQLNMGDAALKWTPDRLAELIERKGQAYLKKIMAEQP